MTWFAVDVEADGPVPGLWSMVSFGAVIIEPGLDRTFYGRVRPISDKWDPEALAISGHGRKEHEAFPEPEGEIKRFCEWVEANSSEVGPSVKRPYKTKRAHFVSDNVGFDWAFMSYYLHAYAGRNPFGWGGFDMSDCYKGMVRKVGAKFQHLVKTPHTHHPVDDAKGIAEAVLAMKDDLGLRIRL